MHSDINLSHTNILFAAFSAFSSFSLDIKFIFWVKKDADVMDVPSQVNLEILRAFNESGLDFAFPTQTIHLSNNQKID